PCSLIPTPPPPSSFPYTTLFRSDSVLSNLFYNFNVSHRIPAFSISSFNRQLHRRFLFERIDNAHLYLISSRFHVARNKKGIIVRSEEHTSELQSRENLVCRLLLQ